MLTAALRRALNSGMYGAGGPNACMIVNVHRVPASESVLVLWPACTVTGSAAVPGACWVAVNLDADAASTLRVSLRESRRS